MDINPAYLKIALHVLNGCPDVDFRLGRDLRLEDLDRLSSENMMKIIRVFLADVFGERALPPPSRVVPLRDFNKFGVGDVVHDDSMDQMFKMMKQIFPPEDDLLHYSVLLCPAQDPSRTKKVISYVVLFHFLCEDIKERFEVCFGEVQVENQEKVAICGEVDDLKEKINQVIQQRQNAQESIPVIKRELNNIESGIRHHQSVLAKLTDEVKKKKEMYDMEEKKVLILENQLKELNKDFNDLESQLVPDLNEIKTENSQVKKQLEHHTKLRERTGHDLEKLQKECSAYQSLLSRANDTIHNFKTVTEKMRTVRINIDTHTNSGNELSVLARKDEKLKQDVAQLTQRHNAKVKEAERKLQLHGENMAKVSNELENYKRQSKEFNAQYQVIVLRTNELLDSLAWLGKEIKRLQQEMERSINAVHVEIPEAQDRLAERALQDLGDMVKSFSIVPISKPK